MTQDDPVAACYDRALTILGMRSHSVLQLRRKLERKTFEPEVVDAVIQRLLREKLLDDERFAAELVRTKARRGAGTLRITRDLQVAGVQNEIARRTVREEVSEEDRRAALMQLAEKKLRTLVRRHGEPDPEDDLIRRKLGAFLSSRGYETSDVLWAIDEALRAVR